MAKHIELDPTNRPWEYHCDGTKVWKNTGSAKPWSELDQQHYDKAKDYEQWKETFGYEWQDNQ
jgi:hypothetical protein